MCVCVLSHVGASSHTSVLSSGLADVCSPIVVHVVSRVFLYVCRIRLEAIFSRLETIALRLETIAIWLEAIAIRLEAIAIG